MTEIQQVTSWPPRLSLKGLFLLVAAVAFVLAPYYWFGGFYLYSVGCSCLFVYVCTQRYRQGKFGALTPAAIVVVAIFFATIASIVFFFQAVLTALVCIPLAAAKVRPRTFAMVLVGLMVAIYGVVFARGIVLMREMRALREKYPITSLEPRLAFEHDTESGSVRPISPVTFSRTVAKRLDEQDDAQEFQYNSRARALRALHSATYQEFAFASGFGPARMPAIGMVRVDLTPAHDFKLPAPLSTDYPVAATKELQEAHDKAVEDFISPERMGYIKNRSEVVGFESHRFTSLNKRWQYGKGDARYWQVVRLELVGLLRHRQPCVYIAKTIPEMEKLASTPHRELNDFEKAALPQLQSQEDIVVEQQPDRIQMLGALRAGKTCLECHHGDRGRLLGAFSYELTPLPAGAMHPTLGSAANPPGSGN